MKLELKHLAGYLPYDLNIKTKTGYDTMNTLDSHCVNCDYVDSHYYDCGPDSSFKPILRPLSDLSKYIGNFCFEEWVKESSCPEEYEQYVRCIYETFDDGSLVDLHYLSYRIIKKMYEYHFDMERLIEAGLAIDINTL